jgi:hypothetical protein
MLISTPSSSSTNLEAYLTRILPASDEMMAEEEKCDLLGSSACAIAATSSVRLPLSALKLSHSEEISDRN